MKLVSFTNDQLDHASDPPPSWGETVSAEWRNHRPEWHGRLGEGGRERACSSLWVEAAPPLGNERLAVLGHFAAEEACGGRAVLAGALAEARRRGATFVVGPMDGNTWRRYRWMDPETAGARAPFFLEPTNPQSYPGIWTDAGFTPWSRYQSSVAADLVPGDARLQSTLRLPPEIHERCLDPARFEEDLATPGTA